MYDGYRKMGGRRMTEQEWFERTYHDHADMLFRLGRHLLGGQDDSTLYDLMQDTFLDAWSKREKLMLHPNIGGWLALSLKNRAMSARQKAQRRSMRNAYSLDDAQSAPVADAAMTPEQEAMLGDRVAAMRELLGEENAALFLSYAVDGCTAREIGKRWGLSEDCVWMRISRMKRKLVAHPEIFYAMLLVAIGMR